MIINKKATCLIFMLLMIIITAKAQEGSWQEQMRYLIYSPRYFGPSAFPLPELRSGNIEKRMEVELGGQYHTYEGDQTKDIFGRIYIPVTEGLVGLEINYNFWEYYYMTPETVIERHAAGQSWKNGARGDLIISTFYKILKNNKRVDLLLEASLKTTTGKRLADARHTDAASYWFDLNTGFHLFKSPDSSSFIRFQALAGFYCWMTNDIVHRQNDAFLYSAGISGGAHNLIIQADIAGFIGYINNGDRPIILRTKLNYGFRKNILSFRYKHGIHDYLYDTYSIAYIRLF